MLIRYAFLHWNKHLFKTMSWSALLSWVIVLEQACFLLLDSRIMKSSPNHSINDRKSMYFLQVQRRCRMAEHGRYTNRRQRSCDSPAVCVARALFERDECWWSDGVCAKWKQYYGGYSIWSGLCTKKTPFCWIFCLYLNWIMCRWCCKSNGVYCFILRYENTKSKNSTAWIFSWAVRVKRKHFRITSGCHFVNYNTFIFFYLHWTANL